MLALVFLLVRVGGIDVQAGESTEWRFGVQLEQTAIGQNLPVMGLDRSDWPKYLTEHESVARAFSDIKVEIIATNPNGWTVGVVKRSQSQLFTNADAKNLATVLTLNMDPGNNKTYIVSAHSQSWQGDGISFATPWLSLDDHGVWYLQGNLTLLQLSSLDAKNITGAVKYRGNRTYSIDLHSQHSSKEITGFFLPATGQYGTAESISFAVKGCPSSILCMLIQANDIDSALHWSNMATDNKFGNSNIITRASNGTLDYGPIVRGRKSLANFESTIGTFWKTNFSVRPVDHLSLPVELNLKALEVADIQQTWLGATLFGNDDSNFRSWSFSYEPVWKAFALSVTKGNLNLLFSSDAKGIGSQYQSLQLGWHFTY
jgi:hypothetical protein